MNPKVRNVLILIILVWTNRTFLVQETPRERTLRIRSESMSKDAAKSIRETAPLRLRETRIPTEGAEATGEEIWLVTR